VTQAHTLNKVELLQQASNYVSQVKLELGLLGQQTFTIQTNQGSI